MKEFVQKLEETGIIPLFSHKDEVVMRAVIEAFYNAGIRVFEFTNRQENALTVFKAIRSFTKDYPDFTLGVGTIMNPESAAKFYDAGAEFIIAPILNLPTGEFCSKNNIPWIPGCATVSEIVQGWDHGAPIIKLFPSSVLGVDFLRSIRPVIPHIPLMITGGVELTKESLSSWFNAGATCVGLGSNLVPKGVLANRDWAALERGAREAVQLLHRVRQSS